MSHQRRRGVALSIWKVKAVTDRRGNTVVVADSDGPYALTGWVIPDRSARAEVPGQQQINIVKIGVSAEHRHEMSMWSRVDYDGKSWDIASPPAYHRGVARHTEHVSIELRERP